MSGAPGSRGRGRVVIALGVVLILVAVVRMNARALGGPPSDARDFSQRRTDRQVRTAVHEGFAEFAVLGFAGFGLILYGVHRSKGDAGS